MNKNRKLNEAKIRSYRIDLDRLHDHKGKLCPCLIDDEENNVKANICPCDNFTKQGECRYMIFVKDD